jgi:hypothetical protein
MAAIVVLSGFFTSCKTRKQNKEAETSTTMSAKVKALEVKPVLLDTTNYGRDTFQANNIRISGDTLFIEAEYSGGCKNHVFTARHNGNYMKSMPPQLNLYIDHQANGDGCRELIKETIAFDLKSCRVGKTGNLILLINADRSKKVTYTY